MRHFFTIFLAFLGGGTLALPQGWCCWQPPTQTMEKAAARSVPAACPHCGGEATPLPPKHECPKKLPRPLPVCCAACFRDTVKPPATPSLADQGLSVLLQTPVTPPPVCFAVANERSPAEAAQPPPLHVLCCVWRC